MTFPAPEFAWAFAALLLAGLLAACWYDLRTFRIPKPVSVGLLAAGAAANAVRGAWVGADGAEVWWFGANGAAVGALDGLAFSLAGAAVGFAVFFVLWVFGTAGGGDVKLATAIAGWVGAKPFFFVLGVTLVVVTVLTVLRIGTKVVVGKPSQATGAPTRRGLGLSYALPLTVGVLALLALMVLPIQVRLAPAGG